MTTLAEFTAQVRTLLLDDAVPDSNDQFKYSDALVQKAVWWAQDQFANHTAKASDIEYEPDGRDYTLPNNRFDSDKIDTCGVVYLRPTSGPVRLLDPVKYTANLEPDTGYGFYTYPDDELHLTCTPATTDTVVVHYFAYYNHPILQSDLIGVPRWGESPLAYLVAAHILSGISFKTANIRQFAAGEDKGTPDNNPLRDQQDQYLKLYEREMAKHIPQERINTFRDSERE